MKKIEYNIKVVKWDTRETKKDIIRGYLYKTANNFYGIDHRYEHLWYVTELRTGMKLFETNRLKDVYVELTEELDDTVTKILSNIPETKYVNDIEIYK